MPKKNESNIDNLIEKIVKKDYNNTLEKVLEKKSFSENTKSILLSILYKIETSYKDYKKVKQNVLTKDELIENVINEIQENCNEIILVTPNSEQNKILGNKTFLVEKNKKRIVCQNIERKVLYCISKISKRNMIIQDKYFLINETLQKIEIAPIYDCASCLYPQLTDERINEIINNQNELEARVYIFPTSALKIKGKKINYFGFITGLENEECNKALIRIFPKINLEKIYKIIDQTPYITDIRKEFYKKILNMRYNIILKNSYESLKNK